MKNMNAIFNIWMQPIYARKNVGKLSAPLIVIGSLVLAFNALMIWVMLESGKSEASSLTIALAIDFTLFSVIWLWLLMMKVGQQFTPANAGLIPHYRKYLRTALALPILLLPFLFVLSQAWFRQSYSGLYFHWLVIVVFFLLFLLTLIRSQWASLLIVLYFQAPFLSETIKGWVQAIQKMPHQELLLLVGIAIVGVSLKWIFPRSENLYRRANANQRMLKLAQGEPAKQDGIVTQFLNNPYLTIFQRRIKRNEKASNSLVFGFGPAGHWASFTFQIVILFAAIGLVYLTFYLRQSGDHDISVPFKFILIPALSLAAFGPLSLIYTYQVTTYQRRMEIGLLGLTAVSPNQRGLTAIYLRYMLTQHFIVTQIFAVPVVIIGFFYLDDVLFKNALLLGLVCLQIPSINILRNYGKMSTYSDVQFFNAMPVAILTFVATMALLFYIPVVPVWSVMLVIVIITVVMMRKRWNKLMALDAVFPAGRAV